MVPGGSRPLVGSAAPEDVYSIQWTHLKSGLRAVPAAARTSEAGGEFDRALGSKTPDSRSVCGIFSSWWRKGFVTGPPAAWSDFQTAPPVKRANPDGTPVRLHDGALIAHVDRELADRLVETGTAESLRRGPRRYLRLRQGISFPPTARGWDIIEFLRKWHGDKRTAAYVAHKDRESDRFRYRPPALKTEK
jgi:hypothetical protein